MKAAHPLAGLAGSAGGRRRASSGARGGVCVDLLRSRGPVRGESTASVRIVGVSISINNNGFGSVSDATHVPSFPALAVVQEHPVKDTILRFAERFEHLCEKFTQEVVIRRLLEAELAHIIHVDRKLLCSVPIQGISHTIVCAGAGSKG